MGSGYDTPPTGGVKTEEDCKAAIQRAVRYGWNWVHLGSNSGRTSHKIVLYQVRRAKTNQRDSKPEFSYEPEGREFESLRAHHFFRQITSSKQAFRSKKHQPQDPGSQNRNPGHPPSLYTFTRGAAVPSSPRPSSQFHSSNPGHPPALSIVRSSTGTPVCYRSRWRSMLTSISNMALSIS